MAASDASTQRTKVTPLVATVPQTGAILQVSEDTIYRMVADGRLQGLYLGRVLRIPLNSIRDLVASGGRPK